jgi:hypothetical protein
MDTLGRLSDVASQRNMLFVVGVARSGTSAMQTALGLNDQVFLFFEANFFSENLKPGFRERYNARHILTGAPYRCPAVAQPNSSWVEILNGLKQQYRFVGEKIAFGPHEPDRWITEFLAFHKRHFPEAAYVLMFRNPRDTIFSPRTKWGVENLLPWTRSYVAGQRALIRLRLNFPRTVPVFMETADSATFQSIEQCVGQAMPHLADAFQAKRQSPQDSDLGPGELQRVVAELETLYPTLREEISNSGYGRSGSTLLRIDASLAEIFQRLDRLHYAPGARLERLRRKLLGKRLWF